MLDIAHPSPSVRVLLLLAPRCLSLTGGAGSWRMALLWDRTLFYLRAVAVKERLMVEILPTPVCLWIDTNHTGWSCEHVTVPVTVIAASLRSLSLSLSLLKARVFRHLNWKSLMCCQLKSASCTNNAFLAKRPRRAEGGKIRSKNVGWVGR